MNEQLSTKLTHAILALDAYNRGYDAKLSGLSDAPGTRLGQATILSSDGGSQAQKIGFYALAYELDGKTVIAFRGTDNLNILKGANDILNGWVGGAGIISTQADRALQYYQSVVGKPAFQRADNVTLTGHSLGGGLAGQLAALSNGNAYVFDQMPYAAASVTAVVKENAQKGLSNMLGFLSGATDSPYTLLPNASGVQSLAVKGEVLAPVRFLALTAGSVVEAVIAERILSDAGYLLQKIPAGVAAGVLGFNVARQESDVQLVAPSVGLSMTQLHSQALLVVLQFATEMADPSWVTVDKLFTTAWFDDSLAASFGLNADKMLTAIAYSAIADGERPFGDTGIRAMFDDAADLARIITSPGAAKQFEWGAVQKSLTSVITQYSANLAVNASTDPARQAGVVEIAPDGTYVVIDLSPGTWQVGSKSPSQSSEKTALVKSLMAEFTLLDEMLTVDYVVIDEIDTDSVLRLPSHFTSGQKVLVINNGGDDEVFGAESDDYFTSADGGNDFIDGGGGINTVIFGGNLADYKIQNTNGGLEVTELLTGATGPDFFTNMQQVKFADFTSVFDLNHPEAKTVVGIYQSALGRLPDNAGFRYWAEASQSDTLKSIVEGFLMSEEYDRLHTDSRGVEQTVSDYYRVAFGREVDQAGLTFWSKLLKEGMSETDFVYSLAMSTEMQWLIDSSTSNGFITT